MTAPLDAPFVGAMPKPEDGPDVFGAHVGLPLADLHKLRHVRSMMEEMTVSSVSLLDALHVCIALAEVQMVDALHVRRAGRHQCKDDA